MAIDYNLLEHYIGKDPLYNLYKERGLFDPGAPPVQEGNILPYSADERWEKLTAEDLAHQKRHTHGYTYPHNMGPLDNPEYDTRLFINNLEQFGNTPSGPLYGKSIMDDAWLDSEGWQKIQSKPGGEQRYLTQREMITNALNADDAWEKESALAPIFGYYISPEDVLNHPDIYGTEAGYGGGFQPTITERNKQIAETIGHEARHQLLAKHPQFEQGIPRSLLTNIDKTYTDDHELLTRMLDFQAYNDPTIYDNIYGDMHGDMPRHLGSPIADAFYDQGTAFTDFMLSPKDEISTEVSESEDIIKEPVGIETISPRKNWFKRLLDSTLMGRIGNQFAYRPAPIGGAGGYTAAQLDSMNARGGWYSEPAREKRRTINRVKNMMARKAAGKSYSQKNLANLSAQISGGRDPSQGNTVTGHGKSGMGRDPRDRMEYGGLATMFERRR